MVPKVSVCISVRNGEAYIAYMLDSLLVQSFDDFEIIVVDNHSKDATPKILSAYVKAFPEKVFVYQATLYGGAGVGRNLAFEKSRGEYIWFCDGDDLAHPKAIEAMYTAAERYGADIVCAAAWEVHEKNGELTECFPIMDKPNQKVDVETAISAGTHFWKMLVRRDLLKATGDMPWKHIFEDIRYVPRLLLGGKNIRFISDRVYYYFRRTTSETFYIRKSLCEDSIEAWRNLLGKADNRAIRLLCANVTAWYLTNAYWPYFDLYIPWVREQATSLMRDELQDKDPWAYGVLRWADHLPDKEVPPIIYVNGFKEKPDITRMEELQSQVFHEGAEVVQLSFTNCKDSNAYVHRAMKDGNIELAAGYFALKNIYERGGVYIGRRIRILNPFGYCKYQNAFFATLDEKTYSDQIFGAPPGNEAIAALLATFDEKWDAMHDYPTLADRIAMVLTAKYGIPLDGKPHLFGDVVSVFPPDLSAVDTRFGDPLKTALFAHDFKDKADEEGYITLPESTLSVLLRDRGPLEGAIRLDDPMFHGNLWKLFLFLQSLRTKPYAPILKKAFHALIWLHRKWKEIRR